MPSLPPNLTLDKYISQNYMGLFLNDQQADVLKKLALSFVKEVSLCLKVLMPGWPPAWEVRLYSRETRILGCEVHKVLYSHVPRDPDELELLIGDFVYVKGEGLGSSPDGWVEATSWLTGAVGFIPINYIERTAESDAWTLHNSTGRESEATPVPRPAISLSLLNLLESSEGSRRSTEVLSESSSIDRLHSRQASLEATTTTTATSTTTTTPQSPPMSRQEELDSLYAKVKKPKKEGPLYHFPIEGPRKIIVARHGERVDFTFGDWIRYCFDETGNYQRRDLNMSL
ncbi:hypothetical protein Pcinc_016025 [Petrolisthes cinctipes]|uniref:SH3 domain-containing protein n=1 Tax=Petrolisthes cinctipes TaxID=88211 RepID=A0AAE1FTK3_PETCI|nr:hypothetical protein Pcinc_016025 [Petrolisthes cinctipes]KAK3879394.1 hypothetical protein Pcinc_016025 [Petrolisthes cinctipes]KAK3879395.1 hypothetical protein Pcinc_016025 [Petrolisthes cinctipes]